MLSLAQAFAKRRHARGSSLLIVIVLLVVLTIIGFAVISAASNEGDAVSAKRRYDKSVSCTEAARNLLMSEFKISGVAPTSLVLNSKVDDLQMASGHYDQVAIASVTQAAESSAPADIGITDISNRITQRPLGGQLFRVSVVCGKPPTAAGGTFTEQNEVEYLVRFGL